MIYYHYLIILSIYYYIPSSPTRPIITKPPDDLLNPHINFNDYSDNSSVNDTKVVLLNKCCNDNIDEINRSVKELYSQKYNIIILIVMINQ